MKRFLLASILFLTLCVITGEAKKTLISTPIIAGSRISYPDAVTVIGDKMAFLFRAKQLNLLLHNSTGKWLRDGLTKDEYDNGIDMTSLGGKTSEKYELPSRIKGSINSGIFKNKISRAEWDVIITDDFHKNWVDIESAFSILQDSLMKDTQYDSLITL